MAQRDKGAYIAIVDIVKAAACIMIFLYHCNTFLPGEWKFLTIFGQDLGNNLFFMVSGFTLAPSIDRTPVNKIHVWYLKRLIRILPITAIAYFATWLKGYYSFRDPAQLFTVFIYPTLYWFITAILVFYLILFLMAKITVPYVTTAFMAALAVLSAVLYGRQERLYTIGLFAMFAGYSLRRWLAKDHAGSRSLFTKRAVTVAGLILCLAVFILGETMEYGPLAALLIYPAAMGFGFFALTSGYVADDSLSSLFDKRRMLKAVTGYVGGMALPLYLVQCFCSGLIGFWIGLHIDFPMSFPVNFVIVWSAGTVLFIIEKCITKCYNKTLVKNTTERE